MKSPQAGRRRHRCLTTLGCVWDGSIRDVLLGFSYEICQLIETDTPERRRGRLASCRCSTTDARRGGYVAGGQQLLPHTD